MGISLAPPLARSYWVMWSSMPGNPFIKPWLEGILSSSEWMIPSSMTVMRVLVLKTEPGSPLRPMAMFSTSFTRPEVESRRRFTMARTAPVLTSSTTTQPPSMSSFSAMLRRRALSAISCRSMLRVVRTSMPSTASLYPFWKSWIRPRLSVVRSHIWPSVPCRT